MGYIVKIGDSINLGIDTVQSVDFIVNTPQDSNARTTDVTVSTVITGKILTLLDDGVEGTVDLAKWSMLAVEKADCYKKVAIDVTSAGMVVRNYILPNAFVVDYKEIYGDTEGIGTFQLTLRQKKDKIKMTEIKNE